MWAILLKLLLALVGPLLRGALEWSNEPDETIESEVIHGSLDPEVFESNVDDVLARSRNSGMLD